MNVYIEKIQNYNYEKWFQDIHFNGEILSPVERNEFVKMVDDTIAHLTILLPIQRDTIEKIKVFNDIFHDAYRIVVFAMMYNSITMIDCMIISKYFVLADKDYERRFMRGKMRVILNEGFKKLYGFNEKAHKKSEWNKLAPILKYFPEAIQCQHKQLSSLLEERSKTSYWWKEERDIETHLDVEKLYDSRYENIVEVKVIMDSIKLFETLHAVNIFLSNMHICLNNYLSKMYLKGELRDV